MAWLPYPDASLRGESISTQHTSEVRFTIDDGFNNLKKWFSWQCNFPLRQYEAEKAKTKGENRNGQSPLVVKKPESTDKAWSQIGDFIDFQAARAAKQTDKERMKSLLFKLKQTPPVKGA